MTFGFLYQLLFACASTLSPHLQNPYENPHPECSPQENIIGLGFSLDSGSAAQQNAHAKIAEQMQSQIRTTATKRNEIVRNATEESSLTVFVQESVVESSFQ